MVPFRSLVLLSLATFFGGANVSAQIFPVQQQPAQSQQAMQQQRIQQAPIQQQPVQVQPIQAPLFGTQTAPSVYQPSPSHTMVQPAVPVAQPVVPQTQMGMNAGQPMNMEQPIRVATTTPGQPVGQGISLYDGGANRAPQTVQPVAQEIPPGMQHMGRSEPASRIIPFFLLPEEQRELDEFLARWERHSANFERYDVTFDLHMYDPTIPGAPLNQAHKVAFGYFKYNASPRRFVYAVEGEYQGGRQIKRDGDKNPHIFAEKVIIDDKSVHQYDYNAKTVRTINVPPEMMGKGIADSPLPLIFGAKADDLKRRFSMRVVSFPDRDDLICLQARPLLPEDQQEFKELEIFINKRALRAQGLRQSDINNKTYKTFVLTTQ